MIGADIVASMGKAGRRRPARPQWLLVAVGLSACLVAIGLGHPESVRAQPRGGTPDAGAPAAAPVAGPATPPAAGPATGPGAEPLDEPAAGDAVGAAAQPASENAGSESAGAEGAASANQGSNSGPSAAAQSEEATADRSGDDVPGADGAGADGAGADEAALDDDLALELLGDGALEEDGPSLDLYGFSDVLFRWSDPGRTTAWKHLNNSHPYFAVGNLNLYLAGTLSESWSSLAEVRFTYAPNGAQALDPTSVSFGRNSTTVTDPADEARTLSWGAIEIERAWVEYAPLRAFAVRFGQWLTPYGIWNVDHGSPTVVGIRPPQLIGDALIPERQTGIQVHGTAPIGAHVLGYHLTLSNGRGPLDAYQDLDDNKAIGGRTYLTLRWAGELTVGVGTYFGRYTSSLRRFVAAGTGFGFAETINVQYDELAYAADARWEWEDLLLQSEVVVADLAYTDAGRPISDLDPAKLLPDTRRWGGYFLGGYRTPWIGLMPYVQLQYMDFGATNPLSALSQIALPALAAATFGVNIRPEPNIVVKLNYSWASFPGAPPTSPGRDAITILDAQIAWSF